jgi:hypothetical protein
MRKGVQYLLLFLINAVFLFSCSGKISIEESVEVKENAISWTKKGNALTSLDIQEDNILNVLHVEHDIYGLIKQLKKESNPNIEIEWFDADKKLIAKTHDHWNYDDRFPDYFVAPDGEKVIALDAGNRVRILDSDGKEIKSFKILNGFKYTTNHTFYNTTSEDFDLLFTGVYTPKGTTLILRTLNNEIIFKKVFEDWNIKALAIAPNKRFFAVSIYKQGSPIQFKTIVLDNSGKMLFESSVRASRFLFDGQSKLVLFLDKNRLQLVDLNSVKKTGDYSLEKENHTIVAADFSDTGLLMIQSAETVRNNKDTFSPWQYVNNTLISLNMRAEMIGQTSFEEDWVIRPALWFDESRKQFFYGHNAGYRYIKAKE